MREYRQLPEENRIEIYAMKQSGKEQNMIAVELGVHPSAISRELSRSTADTVVSQSTCPISYVVMYVASR